MAKKILVTGGAGFIGSHLCEKLLQDGHEVVCVDNLFTGSMKNIQHLLKNPLFHFVFHDVIEEFFFPVDEIYHLACPASPEWYQKNPLYTLKTCIMGSMHVLEIALKNKAKILLASTSEVYGDPTEHPQKETYWGHVNPIGPRSCYDEGKRVSETLFMDYYRWYGVDSRIIRIFNTYGPRMHPDDGRVVSKFILQALQNQDITIYGDGSQTRSFQYVDDLLRGMIAMMENTDGFIGPVNIGTEYEFSVLELARIIISLIPGCKSKIVHKPLPIDDPKQRRPDISLAYQKLGRKSEVSLEDGLKRTIEYFKNTMSL